MKNVLYAAGAIALLSLAAFFSTLSVVTGQIPRKIDGIRGDVNTQLEYGRAELARQIETARVDLLTRSERQLEAGRIQILEMADRRLGDGLGVVDRRVGDSLIRVDTALTKVDGIVTIAGDLRDALEPTLKNTASITAHADEASAILFRRDALPAQLLGVLGGAKVTLGETAQTMRTVRDAAPMFVSQGQKISTDFGGITANINRLTKPHWYDRILGYTLNGAILYRQLNPVTNLTLKGAQIISSQK